MSLCLDKRGGERVGGSEGCPSLLSSPCSEKTFDFKGVRRMSKAFSECSYTETEAEDGVSDKDTLGRFQKRMGKTESSGTFVRSLSARKEKSAVLNRIQKIEQALKDNPTSPPRYLSNCYAPDKTRQKSFVIGDDLDSTCTSKRSSICSVTTEPEGVLVPDKLSKLRQRLSVSSARSESPEPPSQPTSVGTPVNPLPKPKRTFEYDAKRDEKGVSPTNGLPPNRASESPPPLPSTPAPTITRKTPGNPPTKIQDRWDYQCDYMSPLTLTKLLEKTVEHLCLFSWLTILILLLWPTFLVNFGVRDKLIPSTESVLVLILTYSVDQVFDLPLIYLKYSFFVNLILKCQVSFSQHLRPTGHQLASRYLTLKWSHWLCKKCALGRWSWKSFSHFW